MSRFFISALLLAAIIAHASAQVQTRSQTRTSTPTPRPRTTTKPTLNTYNLTFVVSAKDLPAKTKTTKLNPYVKISHKNSSSAANSWTDLGKTDQLSNTDLNPIWYNVFWFEWTKGTGQVLHFEVKDHHSITRDAVLGTVDLNLDDYVLKQNQDATLKLDKGGNLIVKKTIPVKFRLYARTLPKMDARNGLSDPFVECYWRIGKNGTGVKNHLFYKTKVIDDVENADWNETIEFSNYQKGTNQWWHFKVWDLDPATSNDLLGEAIVEVDPFVEKRATKNNRISTDSKNKAQLTLTPA